MGIDAASRGEVDEVVEGIEGLTDAADCSESVVGATAETVSPPVRSGWEFASIGSCDAVPAERARDDGAAVSIGGVVVGGVDRQNANEKSRELPTAPIGDLAEL